MSRTDILEKKSEILKMIEDEQPNCKIADFLHCKYRTLKSYYKKMGIDYKGQQSKKGQQKGSNKYRPSSVYTESDLHIRSARLKDKLIIDGIKENRCEICGVSTWRGFLLPLELHHIDGDHFNNKLDNLMIVCPNCHSIQPGNSGSSKDKYKNYADVAELE